MVDDDGVARGAGAQGPADTGAEGGAVVGDEELFFVGVDRLVVSYIHIQIYISLFPSLLLSLPFFPRVHGGGEGGGVERERERERDHGKGGAGGHVRWSRP